MEVSYSDKFSFIGEWYDSQANLVRRFVISYYPFDGTLEMYDLRFRKIFVRRIKIDGINLDSFYIGCTVLILCRLMRIVDFGSEDTRRKLQKDMQHAFILLKPMSDKTIGKIITLLQENGFRITKMKKTKLHTDDIIYIYRAQLTSPEYPFLMEQLTGQFVYGLEIVGTDAVNSLAKVFGHNDPKKAEPGTIRALFGSDTVRNCAYVSPTPEAALQDLAYVFPPPQMHTARLGLTPTLSNCTMCIVKPHAIREGKLGVALEALSEGGFDVAALNMFVVENVNAAEFYEVYKGMVPEYMAMVEELSSGPCVVMEIIAQDKTVNTAVEFRKLVGPSDPEIARLLKPNTLRAKLGNTKVQNAIHCSDLPEDGLLEVEYFFKILD